MDRHTLRSARSRSHSGHGGLSTARQRVVGPLTPSAGNAGCVSMLSNSVRSLVKPALHVGEQIGGGVGWRATAGRGGIAGGGTTTGGEGCDTAAQADTSIGSSSGIRLRAIKSGFRFIQGLPQSSEPSGLFRARGGDSLAGRALHRAQLLRVIPLRACVRALFKHKAVGLQASRAKRDSQEPRERTREHHTNTPPARLYSASSASSLCSFCP